MTWSDAPRRHAYEPEAPAAVDPRLPDVRKISAMAAHRLVMADIELGRAQAAADQAALAHAQAEQALADHLDWVASERARLSQECQQTAADAGTLRRWRQKDQSMIDSVAPRRHAVEDRWQEHEQAQVALAQAVGRQRAQARRNEKYGILIEKLSKV